jgi:hypothetical protein
MVKTACVWRNKCLVQLGTVKIFCMKKKIILPVVAFILGIYCQAEAAIIKATDASYAGVNAAIAIASANDTVVIPPGTNTWSSMLTINKNIRLIGSGTNTTLITGNISDVALIYLQPQPGWSNEISQFTISGNVGGAAIRVGGGNGFRVDNMSFQNVSAISIFVIGSYGVIDHACFNLSQVIGVQVSGVGYGDDSWHDAPSYGTANALYVEDCIFYSPQYAVMDNYSGARIVFRHNIVHNGFFEAHGTDTSQRERGTRQFEIYNNQFISDVPNSNQAIHLRSGSGVIYSNLFSNYEHCAEGVEYRYTTGWLYPWDSATGANPWDSNSPTLYLSGVHQGPTATSCGTSYDCNTYTVSNANWKSDQWIGYTFWNTNNNLISAIGGNSGNTFTFFFVKPTGYLNPVMTLTNGDNWQVHQVISAMDQVGNGSGDLIIGDTPVNSTTGTPAWPNQSKDGVYFWGNTQIWQGATTAGYFDSLGGYLCIQEGRDFFNNTAKPGYTPLVYPHPLVSGQNNVTKPAVLPVPLNLQVQPSPK